MHHRRLQLQDLGTNTLIIHLCRIDKIGFVGDMFDKVKAKKATKLSIITDMYAALDPGQRTIRAVLKS